MKTDWFEVFLFICIFLLVVFLILLTFAPQMVVWNANKVCVYDFSGFHCMRLR